jgi:ATP-dependent helicase/nuclease subunit B
MYSVARRWFVKTIAAHRAISRLQLPLLIEGHATALSPLRPRRIIRTPSFAPVPSVERAIAALQSASGRWPMNVTDYAANATDSPDAPDEKIARVTSTPIAQTVRHLFATDRDERNQVVNAALNATHESPLAIVVPDLQRSRGVWHRALTRAGVEFNVSLGLNLSEHPYVSALLTLLRSSIQPLDVELIAQALRHPRWARSATQIQQLSKRELGLLNAGKSSALVADFYSEHTGAQQAMTQLLRDNAQASRSQWVQRIRSLASEFTLHESIADSERFQLQAAVDAALETWTTLDPWLGDLSWLDALTELESMLATTSFQVEGSDAPVQLMGLLESAGTPFASLWVTGLTDEVLPERSRQNAFLSSAWQRTHNVGLGSIDQCSARGDRLWRGWQTLSQRLTVSTSHVRETQLSAASPLIAAIAAITATPERAPAPPASALQRIPDERGNGLRADAHLSARKLEAQALCPRRGWAHAHLKIDDWPTRFDGISPIVRGLMVHRIAEALGQSRIAADGELADVEHEFALMKTVVATVISECRTQFSHLPSVVWLLEQERLTGMFERFLVLEHSRDPFCVIYVEQDIETEIDGMRFKLRIDRMELLADQSVVVLDFKTGIVQRAALTDDRLTAPQLPLYALAAEREMGVDVSAVAFAALNDDRVEYKGIGRSKEFAAKRSDIDFDTAKARWSIQIGALISELHEGEASVAPIHGSATCKYCGLQRLCRVDASELHDEGDTADAAGGAESRANDDE